MKYLLGLALLVPTVVFAQENVHGFFSSWDVFKTYVIDLTGFAVAGFGIAIAVIGTMVGWEFVQKIVLPCWDEILRFCVEWNDHRDKLAQGLESNLNLTDAEAKFLIACAILTGLTINAFITLISKVIVPLAGSLGS